jgi:DNA-binding response OmpR family regulator
MSQVLLVDLDQSHAERVREALRFHALEADVCTNPEQATARLRRAGTNYEVVIINVSNILLPWVNIVEKLQAACFQSGAYPPPLFLCASSTKRSPEFELRVERTGARYVFEG